MGLCADDLKNAGLTANDALLQAILARNLHWSDYEDEKQEAILSAVIILLISICGIALIRNFFARVSGG